MRLDSRQERRLSVKINLRAIVVTTGYAYFVLKLPLTPAGDPQIISGVIERLGTSERQSFGSGDELLRLLAASAREAVKTS